MHRCLETYVTVAKMTWLSQASTGAGQPDGVVVSGNFYDLARLHIDALVEKTQCKAIINGSNASFLAGGLAAKNIKILQSGKPSIAILKTGESEEQSLGPPRAVESSVAQPEPELTPQQDTSLYDHFLDVMKHSDASKEI